MSKRSSLSWNPWDWTTSLFRDLSLGNLYRTGRRIGSVAVSRRAVPPPKPPKRKISTKKERKERTPTLSIKKRTAESLPGAGRYGHLMEGAMTEYGGKTYFKYKGEWIPSRSKDPNPWQRHLAIIAWNKTQEPWALAGYRCYADYAEAMSNRQANRAISRGLRRGLRGTLSKWDFYTAEEKAYCNKFPEKASKSKKEKHPVSYWIDRYWKVLRPRNKATFVSLRIKKMGERELVKKVTERDIEVINAYWGLFKQDTQRKIQRGFDRPTLESAAQRQFMTSVAQRRGRVVKPQKMTGKQVKRTTQFESQKRQPPTPPQPYAYHHELSIEDRIKAYQRFKGRNG